MKQLCFWSEFPVSGHPVTCINTANQIRNYTWSASEERFLSWWKSLGRWFLSHPREHEDSLKDFWWGCIWIKSDAKTFIVNMSPTSSLWKNCVHYAYKCCFWLILDLEMTILSRLQGKSIEYLSKHVICEPWFLGLSTMKSHPDKPVASLVTALYLVL